jgi:hypothetical protein
MSSNFQAFLEYLRGVSPIEGFVWLWIALATLWGIQKTIVGIFKWIAIAIRGYQGVRTETKYIEASDTGSEEEWEDYDDDDFKKELRQLKAANINLQAQLKALKGIKNAEG